MGFLSGKRILVTGVASKLSIAYGIAQAMHREGAELAFTYQNDKLKGRVEEFAAQLGSDIVLQCDVAEDASKTDHEDCKGGKSPVLFGNGESDGGGYGFWQQRNEFFVTDFEN